jgi:hypothetical protein
MACPGSIRAEADIPEIESPYAVEGTMAHALAEHCLTKNLDPKDFADKAHPFNKEWIVDQDMADGVQIYVDYLRDLGGYQEYEQQVSYQEYVPGGFGTADAIVVKDNVLHVLDLKFGKGVAVDAEENPQGQLYALGVLLERESFQAFDAVVIHIAQPRLTTISVWETTPKALHVFGKQARK